MEKKHTVDPGIGYKATYKDKKTGGDVSYLKISLRKNIIDSLVVTERGTIELTLFALTGPKKSEKSPDYVVKPRVVKAAAGVPSAQASTGTAGGAGFPF